jgi:glycosyltransferase involved in cell wall biosynthesis
MARALPAIGSNIGGIPELLSPEHLFPADNPSALAGKLINLANQPDRLTGMSARNLRKAREYREDILCERRDQFYERLRSLTARPRS